MEMNHTEMTYQIKKQKIVSKTRIFFKLGFTACKAEQPLQGMELQEKESQKGYGIQEIFLERTYS